MRQERGLLTGINAGAVVVGTITSLALTPASFWLTRAVGYIQPNLNFASADGLRGWLMLQFLSICTVGAGAFLASNISAPMSGTQGALQGFLVWASVSTVRWLVAFLSLSVGARAAQTGGPLAMWIAAATSFAGMAIAIYCGRLGTGVTRTTSKRSQRQQRIVAHPSSQH